MHIKLQDSWEGKVFNVHFFLNYLEANGIKRLTE